MLANGLMHTPRPVRVPTPAIEVRLGGEFGRLLNISATGALVQISAEVPIGREYPLSVNLPDGPLRVTVRIMRAKLTPIALPSATSQLRECLVGVAFTELPSKAKQTVAELCGTAFVRRE